MQTYANILDEYIKKAKNSKTGVNGDPAILTFIKTFLYANAQSEEDIAKINTQYMTEYCWHFAHMLKSTFTDSSGDVYWCAPYGHFVFGQKYKKHMCFYDIEGLTNSEAKYYIPERYLQDAILDFKHIPGKTFNITESEMQEIIAKYEADQVKRSIKIEKLENNRFVYDPILNRIIRKPDDIDTTVRTYIPLDDAMIYSYCPEHNAIFETKHINQYCLIDLYNIFNDDPDYIIYPMEIRIKICKNIISAYKIGKENTIRKIKENIHDAIKKCTDDI